MALPPETRTPTTPSVPVIDDDVCECQPPQTANVKLHFTVRSDDGGRWLEEALKRRRIPVVSYRNFFVFRLTASPPPFVYTIFPRCRFVNVSGVKDFDHVQQAVDVFNETFKTSVKVEETVVDNSTSSGRLVCARHHPLGRLSLPRLKRCLDAANQSVPREQRLHLGLRPFSFPGGVLRFGGSGGSNGGKGSAILFTNAKYVIVGAKSAEAVRRVHKRICAITRQSATTSTPETWSA